MQSWKPQWLISGEWSSNCQRFATESEALDSAQARYLVWTMPTDWRAAPSNDPVTYRRVDDRDELLAVEAAA